MLIFFTKFLTQMGSENQQLSPLCCLDMICQRKQAKASDNVRAVRL